jgi:hypothetical protein
MAYFAQIDANNTVTNVIVVKDSDCLDSDGNHSETVGVNFCKSLFGSQTEWKQTSRDGSIRNQQADIGDTYDATNDWFVSPQPYPSWTLDQSGLWEPPVSRPSSDGTNWFLWNEDTLSWDEYS